MNVPVGLSTVVGVVVVAGLFALAIIEAVQGDSAEARDYATMATALLGVVVGGRMYQAGRVGPVEAMTSAPQPEHDYQAGVNATQPE